MDLSFVAFNHSIKGFSKLEMNRKVDLVCLVIEIWIITYNILLPQIQTRC